jgi:DnaJ-class molecular chaperone
MFKDIEIEGDRYEDMMKYNCRRGERFESKCVQCGGSGEVIRGVYDAWGVDAWEEECDKCEGKGVITGTLPF